MHVGTQHANIGFVIAVKCEIKPLLRYLAESLVRVPFECLCDDGGLFIHQWDATQFFESNITVHGQESEAELVPASCYKGEP